MLEKCELFPRSFCKLVGSRHEAGWVWQPESGGDPLILPDLHEPEDCMEVFEGNLNANVQYFTRWWMNRLIMNSGACANRRECAEMRIRQYFRAVCRDGYRLTATIDGASGTIINLKLLPDGLLSKSKDGSHKAQFDWGHFYLPPERFKSIYTQSYFGF